MKYRVHLYATYRIPIDGVEADSQVEAIQKAEDLFLEDFRAYTAAGEYADETLSALVDEEGDEEFENSTLYDLTKDPPEPYHATA